LALKEMRYALMFALLLASVAHLVSAQAQEPRVDPLPTFRAGVEVFQVRVQVRSDKGLALPSLTNDDFVVRIRSRVPAVLHSEEAKPSEDERRRFKWPEDEAAAIYVLTVEARDTDCKAVPKVTLRTSGVKVRGLGWTPKINCTPPGVKITR
jgi:hypothetical protein